MRTGQQVPALAVIVIFCGLLAACGTQPRAPEPLSNDAATDRCLRFHEALGEEARAAGVIDGAGGDIPGAPWLRSSRWLAAGERQEADYQAWLEGVLETGREARLTELANLPGAARERLAEIAPEQDLQSSVLLCSRWLASVMPDDKAARGRLHRAARVDDEYIAWHRVAGAYPLTRFGILGGVGVWQGRVEATFTTGDADGEAAIRYEPGTGDVPVAPERLRRAMAAAPRDGLGRLAAGRTLTDILFAAYAPVIEIDEDAGYNRIGTPFREGPETPNVQADRPRVYTFMDHADFHGRVLPRLNYVFWFSSRPKDHLLDILGGRLDGMTVRITLAETGEPFHLETMHNCGCYHQHYLLAGAQARGDHGYAERPLVLDGPARPGQGERWVFRLEGGSHYVRGIGVAEPGQPHTPYALAPYRDLLTLEDDAGGRPSLFRPDGMVPGTFRDERVLFWVSGVPDPGAMRQHGRHATAFVGRRHFDDPDLLERVIKPGD